MQKGKPQRMCIACRQMKDKPTLVRLVSQEGKIVVDETFKKNGRGAYICRTDECLKKAIKTKAFFRALKVEIDQETLQQLESICKK